MTNDDVELLLARRLTRSFLRRLVADANGNFVLDGPITLDERDALSFLLGDESPAKASAEETVKQTASIAEPARDPERPEMESRLDAPPATKYRFGSPAVVPLDISLHKGCLVEACDTRDVVAIDFGTAFSKAAVWKYGDDVPYPFDLAGKVSDRSGLLLTSSLYITDGTVFFGPSAVSVSRQENDRTRRRFDSPKQELSILEGADLDGLTDIDVDPSRSLTRRDLLTLYLGYLSAASSICLEDLGLSRYTVRRFAVPVWRGAQLDQVSRLLRRLLVDAQILADTLPLQVWRSGCRIEDVQRVLQEIRTTLTDAERDKSPLVERHVLEAAAAAAAIEDQIPNKRPVVLVVDIGAGTTDLGMYRFVLPSGDQARIYPYRNGGTALKIAGDRLDALLVAHIRKIAGLDDRASDGQRSMYAVRRDIRDLKRQLFDDGSLVLEDIGDVRIELDVFLASAEIKAFQTKFKTELAQLIATVGVDNLSNEDGLFVVLTGGGARIPVFRDAFCEPFEIDGRTLRFSILDVLPEWLLDFDDATQELFPQLAVAVGACSPSLPDEKAAISHTTAAPRRETVVTYKS